MNKIGFGVIPTISLILQTRDYYQNANNQYFRTEKSNFSSSLKFKSFVEKCFPIGFCEKSNSEIPSYINLRDISRLRQYISNDCQTDLHMKALSSITRDIYQVPPRSISMKFGVAFCAHPEILVHAMERAQGEIAVEIGAADGLNAIMLGFGGAKEVYVNDISKSEIERFEERKRYLPDNLQKKLKGVQGNGAEFLKKHPELEEKVGLILCRNLLHLQEDEEQIRLLNTVKKLLKPGGVAIFSVNGHNLFPMISKKDERISKFVCTFLLLYVAERDMPVQIRIDAKEAPPEMKMGFYERKRVCLVHEQMLVCNSQLIEEGLKFTQQDRTEEAFEIIGDLSKWGGCPKQAIVNVSCTRCYSKQGFADLFTENGFTLDGIHLVSGTGHLVNDDKKSMQVVAIVKKV